MHQKNVLTICRTTCSKGVKNGALEKQIPVREDHGIPEKEKLIAVEKPDSDDDDETYYSAEEEAEAEDEETFPKGK